MLSEKLLDILKSTSDLDLLIQDELNLVKAKPESAPSKKPPKKWWDEMYKKIKSGNPDYSDEQIRETIGSIWYHKMSGQKRSQTRKAEGKTYGKAPVAKSIGDVIANLMNIFGIDIQKGSASSVSSEKEIKQEVNVEKLVKAIESLKEIFSGEELEKAIKGEGSRGGKVIGHTRSGKPIYGTSSQKQVGIHEKGWTKKDYEDAAKAHYTESEGHRKKSKKTDDESDKKFKHHKFMAEKHSMKAGAFNKSTNGYSNLPETTEDLIKAIITEAKKEVVQSTPATNIVVDEAGKKLKPTDVRPAKVLKRYEDLLREYREALERNFDIYKLSIKDWVKNSYFYTGNCTKAEIEKIMQMAEKAKPKVTAQVANNLIWNLEYAVRQGAIDNNDPKMNQFKKQLDGIIAKYNKTKGVKKSVTALDTAIENLEKAITTKRPEKYTEAEHKDYADEKNNRYPIDTKERTQAAIKYFGMPRNYGKYKPEERKFIQRKLAAAAKKFGIDTTIGKETKKSLSGMGEDWDDLIKAVSCPGGKIKSKGKGRGLGVGKGNGPIGKPIGEKEEEKEEKEEMETEKSIKVEDLYKALSIKFPVGGVFHIPNKGSGTIMKSENGKLLVNVMGVEHEVDFHKSMNANQNMFTDLFKSSERQIGESLIKSVDDGDITKASKEAEDFEKGRDQGFAH